VRSWTEGSLTQENVNKLIQELSFEMSGGLIVFGGGVLEATLESLHQENQPLLPRVLERGQSGGTVILNVGGSIHQVKWETIDKFPKSRLQRLRYATSESTILSLCDAFNLANREFYFDRSPRVFENILGLYRKGELHLTESVCPRDFLGELEYWGLSPLYLEPCCAYTLQRASWLLPLVDQGADHEDEINPFDGMCCAKLRNVIWKLFEDPNSSSAAKVLVIVSSLFLLASIIMLILSTVPEFQDLTTIGEKEVTLVFLKLKNSVEIV